MTQILLFRERSNPFQIGSQTYRILERLHRGPVTNRELSREMKIAKYTGRLSDIRAKGFNIEAERVEDTLFQYVLK